MRQSLNQGYGVARMSQDAAKNRDNMSREFAGVEIFPMGHEKIPVFQALKASGVEGFIESRFRTSVSNKSFRVPDNLKTGPPSPPAQVQVFVVSGRKNPIEST